MDESKGDRTGQRKNVAAAKLHELLGDEAILQQHPELRAELRVDDRSDEPPGDQAETHHRELDALHPPGVREQRSVDHNSGSS